MRSSFVLAQGPASVGAPSGESALGAAKRRRRRRVRTTWPTLLGAVLLIGWNFPGQSQANCIGFEAAGLPFLACTSESGVELQVAGQPAIRAYRDDLRRDPRYLLADEYEAGERIGRHEAEADFGLTLLWASAGDRRDQLVAEFCGPEPVPVRILPGSGFERRSCGEWMVLIDDLPFPH
jgi:hypothetical protein